jgi:WD40 repeat protein
MTLTAASVVRLLIGTTNGPVDVISLYREPTIRRSVVCIRGTIERAGIDRGYHAFVTRSNTNPSDGVIERVFGKGCFRVDLSDRIDSGPSWQLGFFAAHALHAANRLSVDSGNVHDVVLWTTGAIEDVDLSIGSVGSVRLKLSLSIDRFRTETATGRQVLIALPAADASEIDPELSKSIEESGARVLQLEYISQLLQRLELPPVGHEAFAQESAWTGSPYRSLEQFDTEHRRVFFGRGRAREEALEALRCAAARGVAFLLIQGRSGAGKSSLVRAGLVGDILTQASEADVWRECIMTPQRGGTTPLESLANALCSAVPEIVSEGFDKTLFVKALRADSQAAIAAVRNAIAVVGGARRCKLLLVADQLEELLLWERDQHTEQAVDERNRFSEILDALSRSGAVWTIATLRSDMFTSLKEVPPLSRLAADDRVFWLDPPNRVELKEIVLRPAGAAKLKLEGANSSGLPLSEVLIEAAAAAPDSLPLLQFVLSRLFEMEGATGRLTYAAYARLGELEGAISRLAETTVDSLIDEGISDSVIEQVILTLGTYDRHTGSITARMAAFERGVAGHAGPEGPLLRAQLIVLEALAEARLVVMHETGRARVAHEAVLTHWPRAAALFNAAVRDLELRDRLEFDAENWEDNNRDPAFLITADRRLDAATGLITTGRVLLSDTTLKFISASTDAARARAETDKLKLIAEASRQKKLARWATVVAVAMVCLTGLAAFLGKVWYQERDRATAAGLELAASNTRLESTNNQLTNALSTAEEQRKNAEEATAEANEQTEKANLASKASEQDRITADGARAEAQRQLAQAQKSESLMLTEQSLQEINRGDFAAAIGLALRALPSDPQTPDRPWLHLAEIGLQKSLFSNRMLSPIAPSNDWVNALALSPDGAMIATGSRDGQFAIWKGDTSRPLYTTNEHRGAIFAVAFSYDGSLIASSHQNPTSIIVRESSGKVICDLRASFRAINLTTLVFLQDNQTLISVGSNSESSPRLWDLKACRQDALLDRQAIDINSIQSAALSASGRYFVIASAGSELRSTTTIGRAFYLWDIPSRKLALSNAKVLLSPMDEKVYLDLSSVAPSADWQRGEDQIFGAAFVGDTDQLLLRGYKTLYVVDASSRTIKTHWELSGQVGLGPEPIILATKDRSQVILSISDTELGLFSIADGRLITTFRGSTSKLTKASISPNDEMISAVAEDLSIRTWEVSSGRELFVFKGHHERLIGLRYSNDGTRLFSFGESPARVWDMRADSVRHSILGPGSDWVIESIDPSSSYALVTKYDSGGFRPEIIAVWSFDQQRILAQVHTTDSTLVLPYASIFSPALHVAALVRSYVAQDGKPPPPEISNFLVAHNLSNALKYALIVDVIQLETGRLERSQVLQTAYAGPAQWSADGTKLTVDSSWDHGELHSTFVRTLDIANPDKDLQVEVSGRGRARAYFSPDGRFGVIATQPNSNEGRAAIVNLQTSQIMSEIPLTRRGFSDESARFVGADRFVVGSPPVLIELSTGRKVASLAGSALRYDSRWMLPDRARLLLRYQTGDNGGTPWALWDLRSHSILNYLPNRQEPSRATVSADGRRIATTTINGKSNSVELFDSKDGVSLRKLDLADVAAEYLSVTGAHIALRREPKALEIYDIEEARPLRKILLTQSLFRLQFAGSDERLVTVDAQGLIELWDVSDGSLMYRRGGALMQEPIGQLNTGPRQIVPLISANGELIALDVQRGREAWTHLPGSPIKFSALLPGDQIVLAIDEQATVHLYDVQTGVEQNQVSLAGGPLPDFGLRYNRSRAVIQDNAGNVVLLDVHDGKVLQSFGDVRSSGLSEGEGSTLILDRAGSIEWVDGETGASRRKFETDDEIVLWNISEIGDLVVATTKNSKLLLFDLKKGLSRQIATLSRPASLLRFGATQNEIILLENNNQIKIIDLGTGKTVTELPSEWPEPTNERFNPRWITRVDPTGRFVAVITPDQFVRLYRGDNGALLFSFEWDAKRFGDCIFSADGDTLVALATNGDLLFVNVQKAVGEKALHLQGDFSAFSEVVLRSGVNNDHIFAIDQSGGIHTISVPLRTSQVLYSGQPDLDGPLSIAAAYSTDGKLIATLNKRGVVNVWDVNTKEIAYQINLPRNSEAPEFKRMFFADNDQKIVVVNQYPSASNHGYAGTLVLPPGGYELETAAQSVLKQLRSEERSKPTVGPRLGVLVVNASAGDVAGVKPLTNGAKVIELIPDSPAVDAGVMIGDVIVAIGGLPITNANDVTAAVAVSDVNISIEVVRGGNHSILHASLDGARAPELQASPCESASAPNPNSPVTGTNLVFRNMTPTEIELHSLSRHGRRQPYKVVQAKGALIVPTSTDAAFLVFKGAKCFGAYYASKQTAIINIR